MDNTRRQSRRSVLAAIGLAATAGCLGVRSDGQQGAGSDTDPKYLNIGGIEQNPDGPAPPTAAQVRHLPHSLNDLRAAAQSGGPGVDGIPAIDEPQFHGAEDSRRSGEAPVFGIVHNGEAKAYPQLILVWHEIANDTIGGDPIAITYCPLTGTAQAFDRGETTFGVSGRLINSNLLMYDRGTGSLWPQITAQAIEGPLEGEQLAEKQLSWTTWDKWRTAYPDTKILTEDTGYQRRYGNDPYGSYLPPRGYYVNENLLFEPLAEGNEHPKEVVIGTRTADGAIAFNKERLLSEGILTGEIDGTTYTAVADGRFETGYIYETPDGTAVTMDSHGEAYRVDGEDATPDALPLDREIGFDAMHFAWHGYYPDTEYVN